MANTRSIQSIIAENNPETGAQNMEITCPICGVALELPENLPDGQHLQCPNCSKKFVINNGIATKLTCPTKKQAVKRFVDAKPKTSSPASIKFTIIYTACITLLSCIPDGKPDIIGVLFVLPLIPLAKRKEKAWRALMVLCYISFGGAIVMIILAITSKQFASIFFAAFSALVTLPI